MCGRLLKVSRLEFVLLESKHSLVELAIDCHVRYIPKYTVLDDNVLP